MALDIDENAQAQNLQTCLNNFFAEREVESRCDECHVDVKNTTQRFQAIDLPKVLVLQLKRFTNKMVMGIPVQEKIETPVSFPVEDLIMQTVATTEGPGSDVVYELAGIIEHAGAFGGGHYISYVNHNEQWYCCDDRATKEVTEGDIQKIACDGINGGFTPYVLFYKRVSKVQGIREEASAHAKKQTEEPQSSQQEPVQQATNHDAMHQTRNPIDQKQKNQWLIWLETW